MAENGNGGNGGMPKLSPKVVNAIALVVTIVWAITFMADIALEAYNPPGGIHAALMLVLGGVFGSQLVKGKP